MGLIRYRKRTLRHPKRSSVRCIGRLSVASALVILLGMASVGLAVDDKKVERPSASGAAQTDQDSERPIGMVLLAGQWNVIETHFDRRGVVIATIKGTEEDKWDLDHKALERRYRSASGTAPYQAHGLLSFNKSDARYVGAWFDNLSTTGPTIAKGTWDDKKRMMVWTLEATGPDGTEIRHRVVERFPDDETRESTIYLLEGSSVVKRMEVRYTRTIPCPAKIQAIFGG